MKNPIICNRIVSDITFATRLSSFLEGIVVSDAITCDEVCYLKGVANKLVAYQRATCPEDEKWYFENIGEPIKD